MDDENFSPSSGSSVSFRYQWKRRANETQAYKEADYYFDVSKITNEWTRYTTTVTFSNLPETTVAEFYGCYVLIAIDYTTSNGICVRHIKLEEGKTATAWTSPTLYEIEKSVDGKMDASTNNNNFSWEFSPTEGMFMWNGPQHKATDIISGTNNKYGPTRGAVLAVYHDGKTHKLSMKGHVEADSGRLGILTIDTIDGDSGLRVSDATKNVLTINNKGIVFGKAFCVEDEGTVGSSDFAWFGAGTVMVNSQRVTYLMYMSDKNNHDRSYFTPTGIYYCHLYDKEG